MINTNLPQAKHGLGLHPDRYDPRDYVLEATPNFFVGAMPPSVDMRNLCSPVRDQGKLGSCTGFALGAGLREFLENKGGSPSPMVVVSPLFIYYEERVREKRVNQDAGATIRDGLKVLSKIGVCPEADDPYDISQFTQPPSDQALADAKQFTISSYHRITTLMGLKQALAQASPAVLGIVVYESFESSQTASTGHVPMPQPDEQVLGGHAIFCAGYLDDGNYDGGGYLIIKNSWGTGFGDKGYVYLPYAYVQPKLVSDIWTASL
jgi:C1A family cysteine protease